MDEPPFFLRHSRTANIRKSIKHVAETTIHAIFPVLLSIGLLVQKITSAFAYSSNANTPTTVEQSASKASQTRRNCLCFIRIIASTHLKRPFKLLRTRLNERPLWVISGRSRLYHLNVRFRAYSGRSVAFLGSAISERLLLPKAVIQTELTSRI